MLTLLYGTRRAREEIYRRIRRDTDGARRAYLIVPDQKALLAEGELAAVLPPEKLETLVGLLAQDPRPRYRAPDAEHVYGLLFAQYDVRFTVSDAGVTVTDIAKR